MDINEIIINIQKEQIKDSILKISTLLNKLMINYSNININNNKLINIKKRFDILESNLEYINNDIEELIYDIDIDNKLIDNEIKTIKENVEHTRKVITPFIPYLLLYSLSINSPI